MCSDHFLGALYAYTYIAKVDLLTWLRIILATNSSEPVGVPFERLPRKDCKNLLGKAVKFCDPSHGNPPKLL